MSNLGIQIIGVSIVIDGEVNHSLINLGAVTLNCEGRESVLDTVSANFSFEDGQTTIDCKVQEDKELFESCKYDLKDEDFFSDKITGTFFFDTESNDEGINYQPESMTLFVRAKDGLTKAINLTLE